jgi:hypothetical protein
MKKIKLLLFTATAIFTGFSCKKEERQNADRTELLTQKSWKLLSYGYDYNNDGRIDNSEENISNYQKNNMYVFNSNGTGIVLKNTLTGNKGLVPFNWTLTNNEKVLDFIDGTMSVAKISKDNLILSDTNSDPVAKLIVSYGH